MSKVEIGKTYTNGKLSRTVNKIDNNEVYYTTESEKEKHCWITTFEDWVKKIEKESKNKISCAFCGSEFHETDEINYSNIKYCPICGNEKETNLSLVDSKGNIIIQAKI